MYAITILGTVNGQSFDDTLRSALDLLRSKYVAVEGAAHVVSETEHLLTILIATDMNRIEALDILTKAGFRLKARAV